VCAASFGAPQHALQSSGAAGRGIKSTHGHTLTSKGLTPVCLHETSPQPRPRAHPPHVHVQRVQVRPRQQDGSWWRASRVHIQGTPIPSQSQACARTCFISPRNTSRPNGSASASACRSYSTGAERGPALTSAPLKPRSGCTLRFMTGAPMSILVRARA